MTRQSDFLEKECLNDIMPGQQAVVSALQVTGAMRRRLLDIGLVENTKIACVGRSPWGDPAAFLIRGAVIAIRSEDCANILIHQKERASNGHSKANR